MVFKKEIRAINSLMRGVKY